MITYYDILGLPIEANLTNIRDAYRILVKKHHPDLLQQANPAIQKEAEERLKAINEAYAALMDPNRRKKYHQVMGTAQDPARRYRNLFIQEKSQKPSEQKHDPHAATKLKILSIENEIAFLKTRFYIKRKRFWFGSILSVIVLALMMWMEIITMNMVNFPFLKTMISYCVAFCGAEMVALPIAINTGSLRIAKFPMIGNPIWFSFAIFLGTTIACTSIIGPRTSIEGIEFPIFPGSLILVLSLSIHAFFITQLAKFQLETLQMNLQGFNNQISGLMREMNKNS